jgi:hypothetical protein
MTRNIKNASRRCKIVYLAPATIVWMLGVKFDHSAPQFARFFSLDLPEGTKVETVFFDPCSQSFGLVCSNDAFEPVEDGEMFPRLVCEQVLDVNMEEIAAGWLKARGLVAVPEKDCAGAA